MRGKRKLKVHWVNGVGGREVEWQEGHNTRKQNKPHQMAWKKRRIDRNEEKA